MILQLWPVRLYRGTVAQREADAAERAVLKATLNRHAANCGAGRKGWRTRKGANKCHIG
jgi:hypothetical protein